MKVTWKQPEAVTNRTRNGRTYVAIVEQELRANPLKWALLGTYGRPTTANPRFSGKEFERAYRTVWVGDKREFRVYVRYVGNILEPSAGSKRGRPSNQ
jgi:hypothetical protein